MGGTHGPAEEGEGREGKARGLTVTLMRKNLAFRDAATGPGDQRGGARQGPLQLLLFLVAPRPPVQP